MNHFDLIDPYLLGTGAEIGPFDSPIEGIDAIYIDKFKEYAGQACLADYPGEATALPFYDDSLDFVASSHVLEHISNPVAALVEWQRVLKAGGYVYAVIPDRRYTFDRGRAPTSAQHMIDDYLRGVDDTDCTHIDDFVFGIDWDELTPGLSDAELVAQKLANAEYHRSRSAEGLEINVHFHVFEPSNFLELVELGTQSNRVPLHLKLVKVVEQFPEPHLNGFLVILRKPASLVSGARSQLRQLWHRLGHTPSYPIDQRLLGAFK